ncbi:MAG: hypothetical protein JRD00_05060 [Deltaproteobacteria bacterium]|nr:hypothetical protein [Deltaproteobacteria bacterium]
MKTSRWVKLVLTALLAAGLAGCGPGLGEPEVSMEKILSKPKIYVGSQECKVCHLEHYDSWRNTLHSRTLQDVTKNRDALIANLDPEVIRADLKKQKNGLKVPVDEIYIPEVSEIKYVIGMQWKQGFLIEKNGLLYVAPIQFHVVNGEWGTYHEDDWDKRPWRDYCGGCHAMGVDLKNNTFTEPSVGCEACHGAGSHHIALPETAIFNKRLTIVNPSHLPSGLRTQICGSCHGRSESISMKGVHWPVGYQPGRALALFAKSPSYAGGDVKHFYANEFSKGHRQQYLDWKQSVHAREGVTCTSCHYVHQLGVAPTQFQTKGSGSQQCLMCHRIINRNMSHSIHSFANCIGCHMPRIGKSAESGDTHSHVFVTLQPKDTLRDPNIPNSCQTCHKHKDADLATLQGVFDGLANKSLLKVHR